MRVPVYITNKNRVTPLRRLLCWLLSNESVGLVTILDMGSTYPPLLAYLKVLDALAPQVKVEYVGHHDDLCWVFWGQKRHEQQTGPYIVTDGDYYPADICPDDVIPKMLQYLDEYYDKGFWKVGPSLRLDNLPESPWKQEVLDGEGPYWRDRLTPEAFSSAIDTSFAVYKGDFGGNAMGHAIRLDTPYVFEHAPWYGWPLDDEQLYYSAHDMYGRGHTWNLRRKGLIE